MLPIGGMLTAIYILKKWGMTEYMIELKTGMEGMNLSSSLVKRFLIISALVVAFIIFNEIYFEIAGKGLIG